MTVSSLPRAIFPTWRITVKQPVKQAKEHIAWMPCPRCIGGIMYPESKREHVCIQCGHHLYHGKPRNLDERALISGMK